MNGRKSFPMAEIVDKSLYRRAARLSNSFRHKSTPQEPGLLVSLSAQARSEAVKDPASTPIHDYRRIVRMTPASSAGSTTPADIFHKYSWFFPYRQDPKGNLRVQPGGKPRFSIPPPHHYMLGNPRPSSGFSPHGRLRHSRRINDLEISDSNFPSCGSADVFYIYLLVAPRKSQHYLVS